MRSWFVLLIVACWACGGKGVEAPRAAQPSETMVVSGMALHYNDLPAPSPRSEIADAIAAALRDEATRRSLPPPVLDPRLSRACAALAAVVPPEGTVDYRSVEFALQTNGIIEPSPYMLIVWGSLNDPRAIVEQLRPKLGIVADYGGARLGVGAAPRFRGTTGAIVIALHTTKLVTSPIPRSLPAGGNANFRVKLGAGLRYPRVAVLRPNGNIERVGLIWPESDSFGAQIECGSTIGKVQVQIVADDDGGSSTLATFPVWCGEEPPQSLPVGIRSSALPIDPREAEQQLMHLVNDERVRAGRLPLAWNEKLADVARAHSHEMHRTGVVAFVLPGAGSLEERTSAVMPDAHKKVRGGIARAYAVAETHTGLIEQPTTRSVLLSAKSTSIGIGVVYGAEVTPGVREVFVTELVELGAP